MTSTAEHTPRGGDRLTPVEVSLIEGQAWEALRTVYDPEIPVNICELGLIYAVKAGEDGVVHIRMTLTTPHCPAAQSMPGEITQKVKGIPRVADARVEVVWDPPWHPGLMSEAARLELGL
ncbi:MAG: iron-sulfur cluster assembly protein [Bacteroidota bacterium]